MSFAPPSPQQPPTPYGPPLPPQTPMPPRGKRALAYISVGLICLVLGAAMGGGSSNNSDAKAAPAPTVTVSATVPAKADAARPAPAATVTKTAAAQPAQAADTAPGDGTYLVGSDMAAGTWKTDGPDGPLCYWERAKDSTGDFSSIIANDNITGTGRVTVFKGETFKTTGCKDWTKVG